MKFSIYQSVYILTLIMVMSFGYWPERRRLPKLPKMRFLQRVARFSLRDGVRRSDILRELQVEPLLLRVKKKN